MALPDTMKVSALSSALTMFNASVSNGASQEGSTELNNTSNRDSLLVLEASWSYSAAPTANKTVEVYLLRCVDGTNYESLTGGDPVRPIASFSPPAVTSTRRLVLVQDVPLLAGKYKVGVRNVDTGQTISITIKAYTYNATLEE